MKEARHNSLKEKSNDQDMKAGRPKKQRSGNFEEVRTHEHGSIEPNSRGVYRIVGMKAEHTKGKQRQSKESRKSSENTNRGSALG